jgi:hypothetical protein
MQFTFWNNLNKVVNITVSTSWQINVRILLFLLLQEKYNTRPKKFHLWWILKSHSWIFNFRKINSLYRIQYSPPFSRTDDTWFGGKIYPRCSGDPIVSLLIIYAKWQQFLKFVKYPCPRDCIDRQIPHSRAILSRQNPAPLPRRPVLIYSYINASGDWENEKLCGIVTSYVNMTSLSGRLLRE